MESRTVKSNICVRILPAIFLAFVMMFAMQMLVFAAANEGDTITVTKDGGCNVRKSASTDSEKAGAADKGQSFVVAEVVEAGDYVWYRVESDSVSGYIRGDMVEVTATAEETPDEGEAPEEGEGEVTEEETPEEPAPASSSATLNALEPSADPDVIPEGFTKVTLNTGAGSVTGWQNGTFYIIYAQTLGGDPGWYLLDATDSSDMIWVRYNSSLFTPATATKTSTGGGYLIMAIIFGVLCVLLIIVVVVLGMKQFGGNNNSYDDDDDDDDDDDFDDDDEEEEERPARRPASRERAASAKHSSSRTVVPAGRQGGSRQAGGSAYPQGGSNGRVRRADPSRKSLATAQKPSNIPDDDYDDEDDFDDYGEDLSETKVMPSRKVVESRPERRPEGGQVRTQARRSQPVSRSSAGRSVQGGAQRRTSAQYTKSRVRDDEDEDE